MKKLGLVLLLCLSASIAMAEDLNNDGYEDTTSDVSNTAPKDEVKPISVTPSINVLNFPHPLDGGIEVVFGELIGVKYSQSFKPEFKIDGNEAQFDNRSLAARLYPNKGPFWVGVAWGHHEVDVKRNDNINGFDTNIYANVNADYISPMLGWKWVNKSGFTMGIEFGWIFPSNASASVSSNQDANPLVATDPDYQQSRQDAEDSAEKYVKDGVPTVGLLEIGWTF